MSCRLFNHWLECKWRTLFIVTKFFRELSYNAKCNLQPSEEPEWVHLKHCLIEHNVYPTGRSRALQNQDIGDTLHRTSGTSTVEDCPLTFTMLNHLCRSYSQVRNTTRFNSRKLLHQEALSTSFNRSSNRTFNGSFVNQLNFEVHRHQFAN